MLKFCTNKPIWALLLRQVFGGGLGKGGVSPKKGCNAPSASYGFPRKKDPPQAQYIIVSYCKYNMYFNKYDMYSIVGIDKKMYEKGIGITYIHT